MTYRKRILWHIVLGLGLLVTIPAMADVIIGNPPVGSAQKLEG